MTHSPFHINVLILFTSSFLLKYSHNCGLKERNRTSVFRATTGRSAIELPTTYGMPGEIRTHILGKNRSLRPARLPFRHWHIWCIMQDLNPHPLRP